MIAYGISYKVKGQDRVNSISIDAKDLQSAKNKIGKKLGYKSGRQIEVVRYSVIGYY